ncbi:MAG: hypothetical protein H0X50_10550 [Nitrosopumilus sp.]|nr:hypothetical protein [Nitrosopumilus sp.]
MESKTTKSNMLTIYNNNAIRKKRELLKNHHIEQCTPKCHYVKGKKHNFSRKGTKYTPITNISIIIILAIISIGLTYNPSPAAATPASFNATSPIDNSLMTFNATSPIDNSLMTFNATSPVNDNFLANNLTSTRP